MGWFSAIPAIASVASSVIGGRQSSKAAKNANRNNPANAAMSYYQQNPQIAREQFDPYVNRGFQAERELPGMYDRMYDLYNGAQDPYANVTDLYSQPSEMVDQYGEMGTNPMEYINKIMRGYTPSEGYKYSEGKLRDEARSTAAAGGFSGTHHDEERRANMIRGLLGQDQQQWLGNVTGAHQAGLSALERMLGGRERHQERVLGGRERFQERSLGGRERALGKRAESGEFAANRGFDAARALADALIGNSAQMGNLAFSGQRQNNQNTAEASRARSDMFSGLAQQLPGLLGSLRGIGGGRGNSSASAFRANPRSFGGNVNLY